MRHSFEHGAEQYVPGGYGGPTERLKRQPEVLSKQERLCILSDIHNDLASAQSTLREQGTIDRHGDWHTEARDVHLVSTGDSNDRAVSDRTVVKFLRHLAETAERGNRVTVLLGNHELDAIVLETHGERTGLTNGDIRFLASCPLVYKAGPVLLLHGYPTRALLEDMVEQYERVGGDVPNDTWVVNVRARDMLSAALRHVDARTVSVVCEQLVELMGAGNLDEVEYFEREGAAVSALLRRLGVTTIVHGHRRHEKGGQLVEHYLPGIRMINNDAAMAARKNEHRHHRISAVTLERTDGDVRATCIYKGDVKKGHGHSARETVVH